MNSEQLKELITSIKAGTWVMEEGTRVITDAELVEWEHGSHIGHQRSVKHLRPLHEALRPIAVSEGVIWMNMGGGGVYSNAVAYGAREVKAGRCTNIEMNQKVIENDPHGTKASAAARAGVSHEAYLRGVTGG